jgi:mannose-6-phosphate isomerase-like protein (cupin superfamily)
MTFGFGTTITKEEVFTKVGAYLDELGVTITSIDNQRPWGGFFVIADESIEAFIKQFFEDYDLEKIKQFSPKLMPKILVIRPGEELSWQYHFRRAELWRCVDGPVGYRRSMGDTQTDTQTLQPGEIVQFKPHERHTGVGLDNWGIVAEFWQHTDPSQPSDEEDIIRLEDKYGR